MKKIIFILFLFQTSLITTSFNFVIATNDEIKINKNIAMCSSKPLSINLVLDRNEELEKLGRCYGYVNCSVCSNCSSCNYCNSGGSCGVCSNTGYELPEHNSPKTKNKKDYKSQGSIKEAIKYNDNKYTYLDKVTIERALETLGYDTGEVDGIFDRKTIKAIKEFQKDYHLNPDGKIGKRTINKIKELFNK